MTSAIRNASIVSNVSPKNHNVISEEMLGSTLEIQFPIKVIKSVDLGNKPLGHVGSYVANQKTMVQNMFNKRNLNENLNFKNTFYVEERGDLANKEANTIYGHDKVYHKEVVDAGLKAKYASRTWREEHTQEKEKVKQGFQKTATIVAQRRNDKAEADKEEAVKHVIIL